MAFLLVSLITLSLLIALRANRMFLMHFFAFIDTQMIQNSYISALVPVLVVARGTFLIINLKSEV